MSLIYLDYAAATPIHPAVAAAMQPYFSERFYNPSATYLAAEAVRKDLEQARAGIAHWLGAKPGEVTFTAGGTEANNLAIRGVMNQFRGGNVVVSAVEHESVLAAAQAYDCRMAPVGKDGVVDVPALIGLIDDNTVLVSVMYANNEVGTIQPIKQLAAALQAVRKARAATGNTKPLYLHTDAAQAAAYLDVHVARLGVDMLTVNAGKMYGPKQVGALYVASHVGLAPQVLGGGQEHGLRSGTENVAGAVGFAAALTLVQERRATEGARLRQLQQLFIRELQAAFPACRINGSLKTRLPNNVHVTLPGCDNERVIFGLDEQGILCAAGSACSASSGEPSHVLTAMACSTGDARASLRFTMGLHTTAEHIHQTVRALSDILA